MVILQPPKRPVVPPRTHNAWGRPIPGRAATGSRTLDEAKVEAAAAATSGRAPAEWASELLTDQRVPQLADFLEAGLGESDARIALRGLAEGRYRSFRQAAENRAMHSQGSRQKGGTVHGVLLQQRIDRVAAKFEASPAAGGRSSGAVSQLLERRSHSQARPRIVESASSATATSNGRLEVCLIDVGQGSSGYYPESTLEEAASSGVFHAGTHCYIDHPTEADDLARPERSLNDLAGSLRNDAVFRDGGLWAQVQLFESHRQFILDRASTIGMSIRADGEVGATESSRQTVTKLTRAHSVDFVTKAGRGGRIESWT